MAHVIRTASIATSTSRYSNRIRAARHLTLTLKKVAAANHISRTKATDALALVENTTPSYEFTAALLSPPAFLSPFLHVDTYHRYFDRTSPQSVTSHLDFESSSSINEPLFASTTIPRPEPTNHLTDVNDDVQRTNLRQEVIGNENNRGDSNNRSNINDTIFQSVERNVSNDNLRRSSECDQLDIYENSTTNEMQQQQDQQGKQHQILVRKLTHAVKVRKGGDVIDIFNRIIELNHGPLALPILVKTIAILATIDKWAAKRAFRMYEDVILDGYDQGKAKLLNPSLYTKFIAHLIPRDIITAHKELRRYELLLSEINQRAANANKQQHRKINSKFYFNLCAAIGELDKIKNRNHGNCLQQYEFDRLLWEVKSDLDKLDLEYRHKIYPCFLLSLLDQTRKIYRYHHVGRKARQVYDYMTDNNFPIFDENPKYLNKLLSYSKYQVDANRFEKSYDHNNNISYSSNQEEEADYDETDLPYVEILSKIVSLDHRPYPPLVINVLQNLYPFTNNIENTILALQCIYDLMTAPQKRRDTIPENTAAAVATATIPDEGVDAELLSTEQNQQQQDNDSGCDSNNVVDLDFQIDMGTLEYISAAGAKRASAELCLLVWDIIKILGHTPTEAIYENTIQAFCLIPGQDHTALAILSEMEQVGYTPSRALIRTMSRSIKYTVNRIDNAYYIATGTHAHQYEGIRTSNSLLNVIVSACAEIGDVDRALGTFEDFAKFDITPDTDTYSFLLESLAVHCHFVGIDKLSSDDIESHVNAANMILTDVESDNLPIDRYVLHEYVRLLCNVNHVDMAYEEICSVLNSNNKDNVNNVDVSKVDGQHQANRVVLNQTLVILAFGLLDKGEIDKARYIASKTSERWEFLQNRIDRCAKENEENYSRIDLK